TLPVNLASDMSNITLEINGGNTIKTSGETTVKNLKLNSKATLTIAAGTTLNIGEAKSAEGGNEEGGNENPQG
ncbi:MAG: hypothetical protein Q4E61_03645, partial [Alphaproteobacteria bacterium]|nr:hypothetical protein [Alphaproteobacteria bacterium]